MKDFAIELSFDAEGESEIEQVWRRLTFVGLPSQADHARGMTNAPHVSLAVAGAMPERAVMTARELVGQLLPASFTVRGLLTLGEGSRVTLAYLIEPDSETAKAVHAVRALVPELRHPVWTPHVTLARRVPRARLSEAVAELEDAPRTLVADRLRFWDPESESVETLVGVSTAVG